MNLTGLKLTYKNILCSKTLFSSSKSEVVLKTGFYTWVFILLNLKLTFMHYPLKKCRIKILSALLPRY
jgi:hypothetical protein